ncbi:uncharacterized protein LOC112691508 isoform X2 [Sipha flava]|uniref:Uncharacterized protein LOC112691508 isoform X2 n=1 Tax=Sipha flava TaxID=143950 RepID=A0A8B8GF29_9HEMI|nr:uncharacterized protein LOC112691508 isoform X2 [Sipha flava]
MDPDFSYYSKRFQMTGSLGDVYKTLAGLHSPELRFSYVRDLLKEHSMLPTELVQPCVEVVFNREMTDMVRRIGNDHFRCRDYVAALNEYMKCVVGTEPGTVQHAYALANRSAAYFHLNRYELCLADIPRAIKSKYPTKLLYKLYERAGHAEYNLGRGEKAKFNYSECLKRLDDGVMTAEQRSRYKKLLKECIENCNGLEERNFPENQPSIEQLTGGRHPFIPALSKLVELKCSPTMGRGVFATEDINPGDVVAVDEPYISGASPHNSLLCHYDKCMKLTCSIIPCPNCSLVYFCGEECMQKANEDGHTLECPIMFSINSLPGDTKLNQLAIRWFVREYFKLNFVNYYVLVKKLLENNKEPMVRGFSDSHVYSSENFATAFSMHCNEKEISMDLLLFYFCLGAVMSEYLMISGIDIPNRYLNTIGASLVRMLLILDVHCRKLTVISPCIPAQMTKRSSVPTAYSLYPTIYLFNHSCDPNIRGSGNLSDRIRVMKVIQPIPKGSQLLMSYGVDFKEQNKETRIKIY